MTDLHYPLLSLQEGHWFKLICGASFQHLPAVRNLTLAYTLAGADCIDVAADPAVVASVREALEVAERLGDEARSRGFGRRGSPWLMVSLNDGEDPHFRKAVFDAAICPSDCPRPCEAICPAAAIVFPSGGTRGEGNEFSGVLTDRCYGCGRCLPVCPGQHISTQSYVSAPAAIAPLILQSGVDALEIHTQVGRLTAFQQLWQAIVPWVKQLKLVAISCPDGEDLIDYLQAIYQIMAPLPCALLWQTDGRPMSGDIGIGTTHAAIKLGQKVLAAGLPGFVQLAGGTNHYTVTKLRDLGLITSSPDKSALPTSQSSRIAGVAYGSYARSLLAPVLEQLETLALSAPPIPKLTESYLQLRTQHGTSTVVMSRSLQLPEPGRLESAPDLLWQAVSLADTLTSQLKSLSGCTHDC